MNDDEALTDDGVRFERVYHAGNHRQTFDHIDAIMALAEKAVCDPEELTKRK